MKPKLLFSLDSAPKHLYNGTVGYQAASTLVRP
jgi:hypothetical protein